ncbi:hypothetical protein ORIO_17890 [Cereibacter azotoformans]|uniref:Polysaccharide chain length determinant N-terminal domain-containing protein n=1 Tax=Cereibacter sphaeroides (strain ATCC 17025 / ATH 2.4.3) TaxID=349102 RepID=A4WY16_CERS5|nr:hypothetical protein [Cereibacter azotoformans]ULB11729.1 hypothetical protein ORIO_17890 [Cereibacter azotoformans]
MLTHFRDLIRASHRMILACAIGAGLVAFALSAILLHARPLYEATVTVTMEPSEEELRFNRSFMGVSQFNPATIIAQSHIERLLSRPVAERAIDLLIEEMGGQLPAKEPTLLSAITTGIWQAWNTLNYGYFVPLSEREQMVADLQNALDVEIVEGSYILSISVSYDVPEIAAAAANVIARAYVQVAQDGFRRDASVIAATLAEAEKEARGRLAEKRIERQALAEKLEVSDPVTERAVMLQARQDARDALRSTEADLSGEARRLEVLRQSLMAQTDVTIARGIREVLATGEADLQQLQELRRQRQQTLVDQEAALAALDKAQALLRVHDDQLATIDADLVQLQERRVALDLSSRAELSQVMIVNPATTPLYPKFPKLAVNTVIAVIVGAICALVPVVARDALGTQVRTNLDVGQIPGARSLPPLARGRIARGRRLDPSYVERLIRRVSADRGGWPGRALKVTGFLPEAQLGQLTRMFDGATGRDGKPIRAEAMPALTAAPDWASLSGQVVVLAFRSGDLEREELEALQARVEALQMNCYYLVVL